MIKYYPKFALRYLFELFIENPWKLISLSIIIISFHYAGTYPSHKYYTKIEKEIKLENGYVYLYPSVINNEVTYELVYSTDRIPLKDGKISSFSYDARNVLLWIIFGVSLIFFLASCFEDTGWCLDDVWERSFTHLIKCEIEHGEFVYLTMGRLIGKSRNQIRPNDVHWTFGVRNFRDLSVCPRYQTIGEKRAGLLNKLGIH